MSKYKDELSDRLSRALGKECADVVDELFQIGVLDDNLARKGCAVHTYMLSAHDTTRSETAIISELADIYGCDEVTMYRWVRSVA